MITVKYLPDKHKLVIRGHANYAEKGKDIICAATSMVFYNLCQMMRQYPPEAWRKAPIMKEPLGKNGITSLEVKPTDDYETWIDHDFLFALTGFELLMGQYPEHINLVVTEH